MASSSSCAEQFYKVEKWHLDVPLFFIFVRISTFVRCSAVGNYSDEYANECFQPFFSRQGFRASALLR